jgi:fatty-acyl-CoA synthase
MYIENLKQQELLRKDLSSLRTGICAGSLCPKYLMERLIKEFHLKQITNCYGMTELSPVTFQTRYDESFEKKITTVGKSMPHITTKIVDDDGHIVPIGQKGEICTSGYSVMKGYYRNEEATNKVIIDGFMKTGDLGHLDSEGYLYIEGRKKDTIIRGGENISPTEVENYLGKHPKVDFVQIVAVEDINLGDDLCAWIKLRDDQVVTRSEIRKFCKSHIAHYKIPKYIKFVDRFPMTITNKPRKVEMRDISNKILRDKLEDLTS